MSTPLAIILTLFIFALLGYLLGSINAGIIITKLFIKTDIREHGSGNAGMTNVTRVAGKLPGAITFIWDFLKGVAASGIARYACTPLLTLFLGENADTLLNPAFAAGIGALFCIIGHMFPVFFGFRGGKGVATSLGVVLLLAVRDIISFEKDNLWKLLSESVPDKAELSVLCALNDFFNIKAVVKCLLCGNSPEKYIMVPTSVNVDSIKENLYKRDFSAIVW